jgi:uncharacterized protein YndB with AHSA1/START domain
MDVASLALSFVVAAAVVAAEGGAPARRPGDRILRAEVEVAASREEVWSAWTTEAGIRTFLARGAHIEPRVDGAYEIFFDPNAPAGQRGGDGLRILVYEPPRRLAFTWNAPPAQPVVRAQRTVVTLDLVEQGAGRTRLRLTHSGWGEGAEWDAAYAYFDKAWGGFVLPSLVQRFAHGPIDWEHPPALEPLAATLRQELAVR